MRDEKQRHDIAVFRFGLIAPAVNKTHIGTQAEYFRKVTTEPLEVPHIGLVRYKPETLRRWLSEYRAGGFEALVPRPRSDVGRHRVITPEIEARIRQLVADHPRMSATMVRERLVDEGTIITRSPSESVIRRYIRNQGLRVVPPVEGGRRAFAKADANELWTLDFMHGPRLKGVKGRVRLLAVIDDASRFVVFGSFVPSEAYSDLAPCLVDAFVRHGLPLAIYCDNGAAFSNNDLALACARLEVALIHSRPYQPQGRGKIERFFGTVRKRFLNALDPEDLVSIEALNSAFAAWLDSDYHRRVHSGIKTTPLARFLDSSRPRRWVSRCEIALHFHCTLKRKVRSDCTVSVNGVRYEAPPEFVGRKVELRHPIDDPGTLTLFAAGEPSIVLKPLDLEHNDRINRRAGFAGARREKS